MATEETESFDDEEPIGYNEKCPHCGEPMVWVDVFNIAWCETLFWGPGTEE